MKKILTGILCLALAAAGLPVAAATAQNGSTAVELSDGKAVLLDSEGEVQAEMANAAEDSGSYAFQVTPGRTYYLCMGAPGESTSLLRTSEGTLTTEPVTAGELADSSLFRLKNDKSGSGAGLVSVAQYNEKELGGSGRCAWLQFVVANTVATEELEAVCDLTLSARRGDDGGRFAEGDFVRVTVTLSIDTNEAKGGGAQERAASGGTAGEQKGELVWENVAKLCFLSGDAEESVELSTDGEAFRKLGDGSGAELFVRDFSHMEETGSRMLLTLLNPWDLRGGDASPETRRIYERDAAGRVSDVTALFTYGEADGVGCWQMRTRKLGCYILSDKPLALSAAKERVEGTHMEELPEGAAGHAVNPVQVRPYQQQLPQVKLKNFFL